MFIRIQQSRWSEREQSQENHRISAGKRTISLPAAVDGRENDRS